MRPQQNRRMRGGRVGNSSARRSSSPLTRSYESNGPDVKIRGTLQHIADKYTALARDAQASGDYVTAENYLQHAEHYMRIILSVQAQANIAPPIFRDENEEDSISIDEEENTFSTTFCKENASGGAEGIPLELAFAVESGSGRGFLPSSKENARVDHPRKPIHRRLSRKVEATSLEEKEFSACGKRKQQEEKTFSATILEKTENAVEKLVVDLGTKPRRRRRVTKVEKKEPYIDK